MKILLLGATARTGKLVLKKALDAGREINCLARNSTRIKLQNALQVFEGNPSSRKPVTIGWQRSGMGMFKYNLFDEKLSDSLIDQYNDGCMFIFYRDNVVLEYGGGAIGPQCFPGYNRNDKKGSRG